MPWPARLPTDPNDDGPTPSQLGTPSPWAMKLSRSAVCYIWYRAKHWTITGPNETITLDIEQMLFATNPTLSFRLNQFIGSTAAMHFPCAFPFDFCSTDDGLNSQVNLGFNNNNGATTLSASDDFWGDGNGGYFPKLAFIDDTDGMNTATLDMSVGAGGGNFKILNANGETIGICPIQSNGTYASDVTMQCDAEWPN